MTPLESMRIVTGHFNFLPHPYAFSAAALLPLLMDDPELFEIRPTTDVDLAVKVVTLIGMPIGIPERRCTRHQPS